MLSTVFFYFRFTSGFVLKKFIDFPEFVALSIHFLRHLQFSSTVPDPLVYVLVSEKMKPVEVELEEVHYFLVVPNQLKKLEAYH